MIIYMRLISRPDCAYCEQAKKILDLKEIKYHEETIGVDITRESVIGLYPDNKLLPIIVVEEADQFPASTKQTVLGGYEELLDYLYPPLERT